MTPFVLYHVVKTIIRHTDKNKIMIQTVKIKVPIWQGRQVGIDETLIGSEGVNVEILYKDKSGKKLYPHLYHASKYLALCMPGKIIKGVKLRIIPISMLTVKEEHTNEKK